MGKKGFTLVEIAIVVAILGILSMIAVPSLSSIFQKSKVSADLRTAYQIGRAIRIWEADEGKDKIPRVPTKYNEIEGFDERYISRSYVPQSYYGINPGAFFVCVVGHGTAERVIVGIGSATGEDIQLPTSNVLNYYGGGTSGWAYCEATPVTQDYGYGYGGAVLILPTDEEGGGATTDAIVYTWDTTSQLSKSLMYRSNNDTTIDWGDGTTETLVKSTSNANIYHTYESAGMYTVRIADDVVTYFNCSAKKVTSLNIVNNKALTSLSCSTNQLTTLDLSNMPVLATVVCYKNQLTQLSINGSNSITQFQCYDNKLTSVDFTQMPNVTLAYCYNNLLTNVDIRTNSKISSLRCEGNMISKIYIKTGHSLITFTKDDSAEVEYVD